MTFHDLIDGLGLFFFGYLVGRYVVGSAILTILAVGIWVSNTLRRGLQ
jgi:hypothetical protein